MSDFFFPLLACLILAFAVRGNVWQNFHFSVDSNLIHNIEHCFNLKFELIAKHNLIMHAKITNKYFVIYVNFYINLYSDF